MCTARVAAFAPVLLPGVAGADLSLPWGHEAVEARTDFKLTGSEAVAALDSQLREDSHNSRPLAFTTYVEEGFILSVQRRVKCRRCCLGDRIYSMACHTINLCQLHGENTDFPEST